MGKMGRQRSNRSGFTLLELLVVVAIVSFVTAAVVPTFGMSLKKGRQREAGALVVESVFGARSRAARTGLCHRVRVYFGAPGVSGGGGGLVAVDESNMAECSRAVNQGATDPTVWQRLTAKSVAGRADPVTTDVHAGLVGDDVAITDQAGGMAGNDFVHFEPSGGVYVRDAMANHTYRIRMFEGGGAVAGVQATVQITTGGSVRYFIE